MCFSYYKSSRVRKKKNPKESFHNGSNRHPFTLPLIWEQCVLWRILLKLIIRDSPHHSSQECELGCSMRTSHFLESVIDSRLYPREGQSNLSKYCSGPTAQSISVSRHSGLAEGTLGRVKEWKSTTGSCIQTSQLYQL